MLDSPELGSSDYDEAELDRMLDLAKARSGALHHRRRRRWSLAVSRARRRGRPRGDGGDPPGRRWWHGAHLLEPAGYRQGTILEAGRRRHARVLAADSVRRLPAWRAAHLPRRFDLLPGGDAAFVATAGPGGGHPRRKGDLAAVNAARRFRPDHGTRLRRCRHLLGARPGQRREVRVRRRRATAVRPGRRSRCSSRSLGRSNRRLCPV